MKADLTRVTFDPTKHYAAVVHQQQRVLLDADLNEQQAIVTHRIEHGTADQLGPAGTPIDDRGVATGFELRPNAAQDNVLIGVGTYYVDGIRCENEGRDNSAIPATAQPDLPGNGSPIVTEIGKPLRVPTGKNQLSKLVPLDGKGGPATAPDNGLYLGFLEVWRRHITALDDNEIREVALGGPDTATRLRTMAQVKFLKVDPDPARVATCATPFQAWSDHLAAYRSTGRLAAQAEPTKPPKGPCVIAPKAGYRRLENQLYRVEIQKGGAVPGAEIEYTWSRDNGSVVVSVSVNPIQPKGKTIRTTTLGRDKVLSIAGGRWVELTDDTHEKLNQPGQLLEVLKAEDDVVTVSADADLPAFPDKPKLRRWDGRGVATTAWKTLEDGIEVRFSPGHYTVGDYWLIPARTAEGDIEWPRVGSNPLPIPRHGTSHHFAILALLSYSAGKWSRVEDCRPKFPAATDLINLHYVGGDGQVATPDPLSPQTRLPLAQPLQVGVANGQWPIEGATVRFTITGISDGRLQNTAAQTPVDIKTNPGGVAACMWALDPVTRAQTVEAVLLEGGQPTTHYLPVRFTARLLRAEDVSYDPAKCATLAAAKANTVQLAIDELCKHVQCDVTVGPGGHYSTLAEALTARLTHAIEVKRDSADICICLLPGDHVIGEWLPDLVPDVWQKFQKLLSRTHLRITGCGGGTRLIAKEVTLELRHFASVTLEAFHARTHAVAPLIDLHHCQEVTLHDLRLFGIIDRLPLIRIEGAQQIRCANSSVEAYARDALRRTERIVGAIKPLGDVLEVIREHDAATYVREISAILPTLETTAAGSRVAMVRRLHRTLARARPGTFSEDEIAALKRFFSAYAQPQPHRAELLAALAGIRAAGVAETPRLALGFGTVGGDVVLHGNRITGIVSLDSEPPLLTTKDLQQVAANFKAGTLTFGSGLGGLHITQNRLDGMLVVGLAALRRLKKPEGTIAGASSRIVLNDNVVTGPAQLLGHHAHTGGNLFEPSVRLFYVVSRTAAFVGNTGFGLEANWVPDHPPSLTQESANNFRVSVM
jgi:Family of unknown function (DUF6519)